MVNVSGPLPTYSCVRFLLARFHVDSLIGHATKKIVLTKLDKLPKGSEALDQVYSGALERIDRQVDVDRQLARRALSWITYAQRQLTTKELCHAIAIEPGERFLDPNNINDIEDIVTVCAGLVTVDDESNIIRLVHYTTREYFERVRWHPSAQEEMAAACLTYLTFHTFQSGRCNIDKDFEQRLVENPFFDYSARHWGKHIQPVESCAFVSDLALDFLCNEALRDSAVQAAQIRIYHGFPESPANRMSGLHLTALYGLRYLTERILTVERGDSDTGVDSRDDVGRTALHLAARGGNEAVARLLLEHGAAVDSRDGGGRTALRCAAHRGHKAVARLLLERGATAVEVKKDGTAEGI